MSNPQRKKRKKGRSVDPMHTPLTDAEIKDKVEEAAAVVRPPTEKAKRKRYKSPQRGHRKAVLNHMHANLGLHQTIYEVTKAVEHQFSPRATEAQIAQSLANLAKDQLITRAAAGVYVYRATDPMPPMPVPSEQWDNMGPKGTVSNAPGTPSYHVYETVGHLQDGTPVIKSDNGLIFLVCSLEDHFRKEG